MRTSQILHYVKAQHSQVSSSPVSVALNVPHQGRHGVRLKLNLLRDQLSLALSLSHPVCVRVCVCASLSQTCTCAPSVPASACQCLQFWMSSSEHRVFIQS